MMAQSNAERYNVIVRIRIGFQIIELPTAQSLRPSVRTGAPPFTQGRHEALPRQCVKLQFVGQLRKAINHYLISEKGMPRKASLVDQISMITGRIMGLRLVVLYR